MKTTQSTLSGGASVLASLGEDSRGGSRGRSPHRYTLLVALMFFVALTRAATNDLSGLLQKGLFEEEANRNLDAASAAYETLVKQFDKDRQIGATAIFRLGEVYRKQGKTNEAAAQYERIVRDFAEQTTLVTLSRQNLAGLGANRRSANMPSEPSMTTSASAEARMLTQLKKLSRVELRDVLPGVSADPTLSQLLNELNMAERKRVELGSDLGEGSPQMKQNKAVIELLNKKIEERMDGILRGMELRVAATKETVETAKSQNSSDPAFNAFVRQDVEGDEIRRLQTLIQNSPDLINGSPNVESPLIAAARAGRMNVVNFLLDNGANIHAVFGYKTALHNAVQFGHKAMVELLLQRGANADAKDGAGGTALHEAAQNGFLSIGEVLLKYKADLNARNSTMNGEQTPLHLAVKNGHAALAAFLLDHGDDVNRRDGWGQTPLHLVAVMGHNGMVERLIKAGAEVNAVDKEGRTPLMISTTRGHLLVVNALLTAQAKTDMEDKSGCTALSYAAEEGHPEIVRALLAAQANPNAGKMNLPLHCAVKRRNTEIVGMLLKANADPNRASKFSWRRVSSSSQVTYGIEVTPLAIAVDANEDKPKFDIIKLLLAHDADPNGKQVNESALIFAAISDTEMLRALLDAGADANTGDGIGWPILAAVAGTGDVESTKLLLARGAKVNARNKNDATALHRAVQTGQKQLVELLLAHGADPNLRDNSGQTPLDYAKLKPAGITGSIASPSSSDQARAKPEDLAALLRQHGALDVLPDFTRIRITRQGFAAPYNVFSKGAKTTNQFTLLETVMRFYGRSSVYSGPGAPNRPAYLALPFPDFGRIIIRRPSPKPGGKEQEIKVNLLNGKGELDCANDVSVAFGDVIEIPERVHVLNEMPENPVPEMEKIISKAAQLADRRKELMEDGLTENHPTMIKFIQQKAQADAAVARVGCLRKTVQLVVAGNSTALAVDSWQEGFLNQALAKMEARAALRSSSDLARVKVTRKDAKTGRPVALIVDATDQSDALWLQAGDVIEVPDKP